MRAYRLMLWLANGICAALAGFLIITPSAQIAMSLSLRSGRTIEPGKWLLVVAALLVVINCWALHDAAKRPQAKPTLTGDWGPLAAEYLLLGLFVVEQLHG